jgi:hypothetical protein
MTTVDSKACHVFEKIPQFTADFVYIDGPDPRQVKGEVNGFTVAKDSAGVEINGLPVSADVLLIEHFFWPGTTILIDGRGCNAQFLRHNFVRNWNYRYVEKLDQHIFELREKPWGLYSKILLKSKRV